MWYVVVKALGDYGGGDGMVGLVVRVMVIVVLIVQLFLWLWSGCGDDGGVMVEGKGYCFGVGVVPV